MAMSTAGHYKGDWPSAWLGYSARAEGGFNVRICAWCKSKKEAEELAAEAQLEVTHGLCPECEIVLLKQISELTPKATVA